jgi:ubiquinone/menaquinone biosynthesis C-methylase UbiE
MKSPESFWNKIADRYSKRPVADEGAYQRKLELTRRYFRPDFEVLEIGCGTGSTAIAHAPFVKHIHATDFSSRMIEIAQRKARDQRIDNVSFEQAGIDELDVPDQSVDTVLALSILHLLKDRDDAIRRIWHMLKPGGVFVSSTACVGDTRGFFRYVVPLGMFFGGMSYVNVFTTEQLVQSVAGAGFEIHHQWQPGKGKAVFIVAKKPA